MVCHFMGTMVLSHKGKIITIDDCLFIPGFMTLVSARQITRMGFFILLHDEGLCVYKSIDDLRLNQSFIQTDKRITDKMWTLPIKAALPYKSDDPEQMEKSKRGYAAMLDDAYGEWSAQTLHEAHFHAPLAVLKSIYPHLQNVEKLPICDACMSQAPRKKYKKKYKVQKMQFIPPTTSKVDDTATLSDPTADDPPAVNTVDVSPEPSGPHPREVKVDDPNLIPMTNNPPGSNIEVTTYDIGMASSTDQTKHRFGRYLCSDTKYVRTESVRGYNYLFIVLDKDTRVTYAFLGVQKSDFTPIAKRWIRKFHNQYGCYPEYWKFDQGGEFLNESLLNELENRGVTFLFSTTQAHNQNAYAERSIGVVWNGVLKMLACSGVPMQFWCYCACYGVFVLNHLPHRGIGNAVPYTRAHMHTHYEHIFPFGCEVWFVVEGTGSNESLRRRGVFLGMSSFKQGYEILDIETRQVITSRNVSFHPTRYPFVSAQQPCKIHLDFGTWPSPHVTDRVSLPEVPSTVIIPPVPPTVVIPQQPEFDERGGLRIDNIENDVMVAPQPDATVVPQTQTVTSPQPNSDSQTIEPPPQNDPQTVAERKEEIESNDVKSQPLSPIPAATPGIQDTSWRHNIFEISPEPRQHRQPKLPSQPTVNDSVANELDEKHTGEVDKAISNDIENLPKSSIPVATTSNDDGQQSSIINPMSRLTSTQTPGEPTAPVKNKSILNTPLDDTLDDSQPMKGSLKALNLRPRKTTSKKKKKFMFDVGSEHPPVRFESDREPTKATLYEIDEILGRRVADGGKRKDKFEYLVKWKRDENGFDWPDPQWIPGGNILPRTRNWYDKTHHPKPTKGKKDEVKPPRTRIRSTTGSMRLRGKEVESLNEKYLSKRSKETAYFAEADESDQYNRHDHFGKIPRFSSELDEFRAEKAFASWSKPTEIDKTATDYLTPVDPIEQTLHHAFETIAAVNSSVHAEMMAKPEKKKKIRINKDVTIEDITDEENARSVLALRVSKLNANESIFLNPHAFEETLLTKEYDNKDFVGPENVLFADEGNCPSPESSTATHNAVDQPPCDDQPQSKSSHRIPRKPIPLPPRREVKPIKGGDITLPQLVQLSEVEFSAYLAKVIAEQDEKYQESCFRAVTTGEVTKEELTMEPAKSQREAYGGEFKGEYVEAEHRELKGLVLHGTFEEVYCPPDRTPITCRWAYDLKRDKEGRINLFKARLVVHGFKQVEGIDFNKTFSSTAQLRTFRLVVATAVAKGYSMTQYDISQAFLNGTLEEDLYMNFPPGYPSENKGTVLKLLKGLYGLKQASRIWQKTLYKALQDLGMVTCKTESGVLRWPGKDHLGLVVCWVDDLIIICDDDRIRKKIEQKLSAEFLTKMIGKLEHYVGIVLEREKNGSCELKQGPYIRKVTAKFEVARKFFANVPAQSERLSKADCPTSRNDAVDYPYLSVVGSLLYAAICTRPDIFYAVMQLARFNSNPGKVHVKAAETCLRYLEGTSDLGIKYTAPKDKKAKLVINAFVDSDWGGCPDTRRSTMGYIIQVCGGPVSWRSKLMATMALSSCEAEFMALTEVCRELMWMCRFLDEIGVEYEVPNVYCDSSSAINWAEDPVQHQRNKHVEIKYYYCRDVVADERVRLFKIHTTNNCADMMTKPVGRQVMDRIKMKAMGHEPPIFDDA